MDISIPKIPCGRQFHSCSQHHNGSFIQCNPSCCLGCGHGHYENINARPLPKGWNLGMALTLIYNYNDVPLMRQRDRGI